MHVEMVTRSLQSVRHPPVRAGVVFYPTCILYSSQNSFRKKSKNYFARVMSSAFLSPGITATKLWFFEKPNRF